MNLVRVQGGDLAVWSYGYGKPVIFLHGGPGDTHDYMKRMAEPLFEYFQCIFFDQRGTGGSANFKRQESEFKVELLISDLIAVASHFDADRPALVGHSWGAMYALFACVQFPNVFSKAALISMGPLDTEMGEQTGAHLMSVLNAQEKSDWTRLRKQRNTALDAGDFNLVDDIDRNLMRLRVKAWVFKSELRAAFLEEYFLDPPPDREVNKWVWSSAETWFCWDSMGNVRDALWLCTGENDSVPLSQTDRILSYTTSATSTVLEKCGHIPWLEHPELFYRKLRNFLSNE